MLTDEDDARRTHEQLHDRTAIARQPADELAARRTRSTFLDQLKGNRTRWAAAVIAGDGDCSRASATRPRRCGSSSSCTLANGRARRRAACSRRSATANLTQGLQGTRSTTFQSEPAAMIIF